MAEKLILVDTSILIDYYRKTEKDKSLWINLIRQEYLFAISVVTKYEIYSGATQNQVAFWDDVLRAIIVLPLDEKSTDVSVSINSALRSKRKQIGLADLFIAATAVSNNLSLATLNIKHFERIDTLQLIY